KADVGAAALERELENANERLVSLMQELALAQQVLSQQATAAAAAAEAAARVSSGDTGAANTAEERLRTVERELSTATEKLAESEREHARTSEKLAALSFVRLQEAPDAEQRRLAAAPAALAPPAAPAVAAAAALAEAAAPAPSMSSPQHAVGLTELEASSRLETLSGRLEDAERDAATSKMKLARAEDELASLGASR
ncbi:unnamed protein product, partial [Laminaria digitata]